MKIYNYDPQTKVYTGESVADKSPLEDDVYLIPQHATQMAPPKYGKFQIPVWQGDKWALVSTAPPEPTPQEVQARINFESRGYLQKTDWYVIRATETGVPVPDDVLKARAEARAAIVE